ncbi:hypothetical protein KCU61_g136, partial [Aureobasidium melanogenum]
MFISSTMTRRKSLFSRGSRCLAGMGPCPDMARPASERESGVPVLEPRRVRRGEDAARLFEDRAFCQWCCCSSKGTGAERGLRYWRCDFDGVEVKGWVIDTTILDFWSVESLLFAVTAHARLSTSDRVWKKGLSHTKLTLKSTCARSHLRLQIQGACPRRPEDLTCLRSLELRRGDGISTGLEGCSVEGMAGTVFVFGFVSPAGRSKIWRPVGCSNLALLIDKDESTRLSSHPIKTKKRRPRYLPFPSSVDGWAKSRCQTTAGPATGAASVKTRCKAARIPPSGICTLVFKPIIREEEEEANARSSAVMSDVPQSRPSPSEPRDHLWRYPYVVATVLSDRSNPLLLDLITNRKRWRPWDHFYHMRPPRVKSFHLPRRALDLQRNQTVGRHVTALTSPELAFTERHWPTIRSTRVCFYSLYW